MSNTPPPKRSPQEELRCKYASLRIEQIDYLHPEFRLELVEGKFLVGGTLEGSRWLLKEALMGWGAEAAIAFAPLEYWWSALRTAYRVLHQSPDDWLVWAESLPAVDLFEEWWPPLGSLYGGEHRWVRDRLRQALSYAVSEAGLGKCFGPHYGMWIGNHVFTPDMMALEDVRLAENRFYDCYLRGPANLVVEIVLPEHAEIDEKERRHFYEQHGVSHYWTVNPIAQQVQFWRNTPEGFQTESLDADGSYRGFPGLTFTPDLLWVNEDRFPALPLGLPIIAGESRRRRWQLQSEECEGGGSWDSVPFEPQVQLEPTPIQPEQFIAWCPEAKLECSSRPLIGGGEWGTRNAIAMLLMSLGLIETVRLLPAYEWVRVLRRIEREQRQDLQKRQAWWKQAEEIAQQLQQKYGVGGVGSIGDLQQSKPLNCWSKIHLVLWNVPEQSSRLSLRPETNLPVHVTDVAWATPAEWEMMNQNMRVLIGEWNGQEHPTPRKRALFYWVNET